MFFLEGWGVDSFEEFAKVTKMLTVEEVDQLDYEYQLDMSSLGDLGEEEGYFYVYAHRESFAFLSDVAKRLKLNIATQTINEGDESTTFSYENRVRFVNREKFYLTQSDIDCEYNDVLDIDVCAELDVGCGA